MYGKNMRLRDVGKILTVLTFVWCSCTACPSATDAKPFTLEQILGHWNVIAATQVKGRPVSNCARLDITSSSPASFHIALKSISAKTQRVVNFNAKVDMANMRGQWQLVGSRMTMGPFVHRIVEIDESYLAMVICDATNETIPSGKRAIILSRDLSYDPTRLQEMKNKLRAWFKLEEILNENQENCQF